MFRRRRWFQGRRIRGIEDLAWFRPDGEPMTDDDWENGYARAVGVFLNGDAIPTTDAYGGRIVDDSFFVMFNASETDLALDGARRRVGSATGSSSSTPTSPTSRATAVAGRSTSSTCVARSMVVPARRRSRRRRDGPT